MCKFLIFFTCVNVYYDFFFKCNSTVNWTNKFIIIALQLEYYILRNVNFLEICFLSFTDHLLIQENYEAKVLTTI